MQNRNTLGVAFLCLGVLVFSLQDAIIKQVSGDYSVTEAVTIRSLIAIPILAWLVHREAGLGAIASPRFWWLTLRAFALFISYTAYYLAFPALPLADAVALYFTAPLFITALAGPFLGERVGWRSWAAIFAGFAGVIIMLQPGSSLFEPAALLSLLSALLYGSAALMTRRLGITETASVMSFYQTWVFLVGAAGVALFFQIAGIESASHPSLEFLVRPWTIPVAVDFSLMAACGAIAAVGMVLLTHAYRIAQANLVTAFEYTGILWVPLWGFVFFAEVPRWTTVLGAILIVAAGVIALDGRSEGERNKMKNRIAAGQPPVNGPVGGAKSAYEPNPATTENLLAALRQIAACENSDKTASISIADAEELCSLGLATAYSRGRYATTSEGKVVLKKTYGDAFPSP
jgi:drug/metabolite transporter (DMT)-like permease